MYWSKKTTVFIKRNLSRYIHDTVELGIFFPYFIQSYIYEKNLLCGLRGFLKPNIFSVCDVQKILKHTSLGSKQFFLSTNEKKKNKSRINFLKRHILLTLYIFLSKTSSKRKVIISHYLLLQYCYINFSE